MGFGGCARLRRHLLRNFQALFLHPEIVRQAPIAIIFVVFAAFMAQRIFVVRALHQGCGLRFGLRV